MAQCHSVSDNQATIRYSYRLRPGVVAEARLTLEWNCARYVWNQCVEAGNDAYAKFKAGIEHESPTFCRMAKNLTALRAKHDWLREGSSVVQQQTVRKWSTAYQQSFKRSVFGFPYFKSRKTTPISLEYTSNAFRIKFGNLCLAGGISIPVVWSRHLPSQPKSCVVTRDGEGHWNVSFVVRRNKERFPISDSAIGIDWGVRSVAVTTDPAGFRAALCRTLISR